MDHDPRDVSTVVEVSVEIDAEPATVYELWTTAEGMCAWWGRSAEVDARPGGAVVVDIDGEHVVEGEFVELDPPRRIVMTFGWREGTPPPGSTTIEVTFDARSEGGTRVVLRHTELPLDEIVGHVQGWTHFLGAPLPAATS